MKDAIHRDALVAVLRAISRKISASTKFQYTNIQTQTQAPINETIWMCHGSKVFFYRKIMHKHCKRK